MDLRSWASRRRGAVAAGAALAVLWGALALLTWRRNAAWESRRSLWEDSAAKSPGNARAHLSLGFALREAGRYDDAVAEYTRALACARGDVPMELQILRNLSAVLLWSGRYPEAEAALRRALAKAPDEPEILTNLAITMLSRKEFAQAEEIARRVVAADPDQGDAWNALGAILLGRGELVGAQAALERAVALDPDMGVRHYNLGRVYHRRGRTADACDQWRQALQMPLAAPLRAEVASAAGSGRCPP